MPEATPAAAVDANQRGYELACEGRYGEAVPHYLEALRLAPSWVDPWFNLGIAYKQTSDFAGSLRACERALAIDPEAAGPGALWNLGIAATAIGDWARARKAWKDFGLNLPPGEGPIEGVGVLTPVRINARTRPEVVWALRIDPARARLRSVPLPASRRRYDDLVLHDGAPNGYRRLEGRDIPVFDELSVLEPSRYETWSARLVAPESGDLDDLAARLSAAGVPFEDWTGSVQMLCERCSTGVPHEHHGDEAPPAWSPRREIGMALRGEASEEVLRAWTAAGPGRRVEEIEKML